MIKIIMYKHIRIGVVGAMLCYILFFVACKPSSQLDLCGNYIADYNIALETLILNQDGTYIQKVTLKSKSKQDIATGTWSYNPSTGYITFNENFMTLLDGYGKFKPDYQHPRPGLVIIPADKYFCFIIIGVSEGILYKKK